MAHDVFISYSSKDKTTADTVCAKLEEKKIRCWIAPRDIPAGQNFAKSIIKAINDCKVFVLVWSESTNTSEHILNEINQAFDQGITIIPFRIQEVEPTLEMRYYFGRTHWLDALTPPLEKHIDSLAQAIMALLGSKREEATEHPSIKSDLLQEETKRGVLKPLVTLGMKSEQAAEGKGKREPPPKPDAKTKTVRQNGLKETLDKYQHPKTTHPKKTFLVPVFAGVLVVIVLAVMYFSGVFKGFTSSVSTEGPIPSVIPTKKLFTASPSETPTPAWVNEFSAPILAAIKDRPPDFQDDFSGINSYWSFDAEEGNCPNTKTVISDGRLQLASDPSCNTFASLNKANPVNYVVQFEIQRWESIMGYWVTFSMGNDYFERNYDGSWQRNICDGNNCSRVDEGYFLTNLDGPETITLIGYGNKRAVYRDGVPVVYNVSNESSPNQDFNIQGLGQNTLGLCEIDNLKIWDLDKIESLSSFPTTAAIPTWVNEFSEPILAAIKDRDPDFLDDFSSIKQNWNLLAPENSIRYAKISNGKLQLSSEAGVALENVPLFNFILQVDMDLDQLDEQYNPQIYIGDNTFTLKSSGDWESADWPSGVQNLRGSGHFKINLADAVTITIISYKAGNAVYLNNSPILYYVSEESNIFRQLQLRVRDGTSSNNLVEFDNLKIWDLNNIENLSLPLP